MINDNPLLQKFDLPPYSSICPEHVAPAIDIILTENRIAISTILSEQEVNPSWKGLVLALDSLSERLQRAWGPVSHLNAVCNDIAWREAYESCLPKLSAYWTELGQNKSLYHAYQTLAESEQFKQLDSAQQRIVQKELQDFRLSGVNLEKQEQQEYASLQLELSQLSNQFSNNLLDATQDWTKHVLQEELLTGIPSAAKRQMQRAAKDKELDGWLITLDFPNYYAVITYADNRALREEIYKAYVTRASDQTVSAEEYDNGPIMARILEARHRLALLLDFHQYAELSLVNKMARTPEEVMLFLRDLASSSHSFATKDLRELTDFAITQGCDSLQSWDLGYYSEKLKEQRYCISQQILRNYFPVTKVLAGLFIIVEKLYGINITEKQTFDRWHKDVRLFEITENNQLVGHFFIDLYARSNKRSGAWMDGARDKWRTEKGQLDYPIALLVCNFEPPSDDQPALLTHEEVTTLFHEFGHGLHHLLTQIEHLSASGINGVAWDAVELPSQFMENWCWEPEALQMISAHYETGQPLPDELLDKMLAAKNFQSGLSMLRQLEFSLFDIELHATYGDGRNVMDVMAAIRQEISVFSPPVYNRFPNSFAHIFAGGYAAGYYSYKWAEVLSSDAFSRFEDEGIFNPDTGRSFRQHILSQGGSCNPMQLFIDFRGREPQVSALLRHSGLVDGV